jgi:uncharacterized protein YkwD
MRPALPTRALRAVALVLALALPASRPAAAPAAGPVRYGAEADLTDATPLEEAVLAAARSRLGGRPARAPSLSAAARGLAARAADGEPAPLSRAALRLALAEAGAFDPSPSALAVCGPAERLPGQVATALRDGAASHLGVGVAEGTAGTCAVVLLGERHARLDPFPREVPAHGPAALGGALVGLSGPRVFLTLPDGRAREVPARDGPGQAFEARIPFAGAGRYLVEVLGSSARGPEVAALLVVSAGGAPLAEPSRPADDDDRDDEGEAKAAEDRVAAAVNRLRARHDLPPLAVDGRLREAARRHSADMLAAGGVAHVLPGGQGAAERLRRARIPFRRALENLARAGSAAAAHESIEESPAHLANLLDPGAARLGVGLARGRLPGGEPTVYLTELLVEPVDDSSDTRLRPEERVRLALWKERERLRAPALLADPMLDALAARAARDMLRAGELAQGDHASRALALGRKVAALDAFVAAAPGEAVRSTNLPSARFRRVGVGVAIGDSPTYGTGLLWIAVLYTD